MFNMGYNLMMDCWNQGYTIEAAAKMLKFAVEDLDQKKMYAYHAKENIYSGRVLEKIGFRYIADAEYDNMDKSRHYEAREYLFELP